MGTTFRIVLYTENRNTAQKVFRDAFKRVDTLNQTLSDYLPESELSRLSQTAGTGRKIRVSDELFTVLQTANTISEATDGAFDVTVGPYARLWKIARAKRELPPPARIRRFRNAVGYLHIEIDPKDHAIHLIRPDMFLDLGGIAKGYAADQVLQTLAGHGIRSALVDAGGDIVLGNAPPGKEGWSIAIGGRKHPDLPILLLKNCAIATSGDIEQSIEIEGTRYSHIVDPRTGTGLTNQTQATLIAPTGIEADALASAACILSHCKIKSLLKARTNIQAYILQKQGGQTNLTAIP